MTSDSMQLSELLEKAGANDIVRDMIGFVAQRLMELDVDNRCGARHGERTTPIMDAPLLLIEPKTAAAYQDALDASSKATQHTDVTTGNTTATPDEQKGGNGDSATAVEQMAGKTAGQIVNKRFYGSLDLDPIQAKKQFADVVEAVVQHFAQRSEVKVRIAVEIHAESATGFDAALQRVVKENCSVLKFKNAGFEAGE